MTTTKAREWVPTAYMERAMQWMLERSGCGLLLDPGMRKTSITLACIDILIHTGEIKKTLVVAPLRVCRTVWAQEGQKWRNFNHLKIVSLCNLTEELRRYHIQTDHDVYLINPESLVKVLPLLTAEFDMLVLDESTKFKDPQTQRFKALKKKLYDFKRRVILTGTPVPNGLQDLFGQMFVVDFGASLGKYITHFRNEFCYQRPGDLYGWHLRAGAPEDIYKRVDNKLMRLDIKDHIDMPEMVNNFIMVKLPEPLVKSYKELEKHFVAQLEENVIAAMNPSATGMKLRQMANGFIYEGDGSYRKTHHLHDEKLDALEELVEEMQGRPLLVAYEFEADRDMIQARFDGIKLPLAVDLGKSKMPEQIIEKFNRGEIPLLIAHPASAGHGLNLQEACNTICWYGITWNLELYIQFNDRVYRSGQEASQVVIHHIICADTKDEDVMGALEGKDRTQRAFNDAVKKAA